jgi:glyoxylate/hydroxypyruvate reductase A
MSIAIIFNNKTPENWAETLKKHLPKTQIEIYPDIKDFGSVDFALCWKPETDVLSKFPNLKVIHSVGAAVDHITKTQNINENQTICRIVDENLSNDMFEFLLAAILNHIKNLAVYQSQKAHQNWQPQVYRTFKEITVSILGIGNIGAFVAEKLAVLGFNVKGWALSEKSIIGVKTYTGESELGEFLNHADILINILPVTPQTEGIINKKMLAKISKGGYLINVGRGEHLIEEDLIDLLDNEHLSGALLDVFNKEPLPKDHPFWAHPKIQITPHIASVTNISSAALLVVDNYQNLLKGLPLKHTLNLEKGY